MTDQHPSFEELVAYASGELAGELTGEQAAAMESAAAASTVAQLRRVLELLRTDESEPVPADARRAAWAAFRSRGNRGPAAWLAAAERLVASLLSDSRAQVAMAGYRGAPSTYRLAFESPCGRIDLQLMPPGEPALDAWRIHGQLMLHDDVESGAVALTTREASPVAVTDPDEHGCFCVEATPGNYDLLVEVDDGARAIVIQDLEIGRQRN